MKHHREPNYAKRARRRFCGASRKTPDELVLSGKRSLEEWVEVLAEVLTEERSRGKQWLRQARVEPRDEFAAQCVGATREN